MGLSGLLQGKRKEKRCKARGRERTKLSKEPVVGSNIWGTTATIMHASFYGIIQSLIMNTYNTSSVTCIPVTGNFSSSAKRLTYTLYREHAKANKLNTEGVSYGSWLQLHCLVTALHWDLSSKRHPQSRGFKAACYNLKPKSSGYLQGVPLSSWHLFQYQEQVTFLSVLQTVTHFSYAQTKATAARFFLSYSSFQHVCLWSCHDETLCAWCFLRSLCSLNLPYSFQVSESKMENSL